MEFYGLAYDLGGCKVPKMRFLAMLRRRSFYISLSRGLAVGTLLNIALLASMNSSQSYTSDEKALSCVYNFSRFKLIVVHNEK